VRKALMLVLALTLTVAAVAAVAQAGPQARQGMYGIQITGYKVNKDRSVTVKVKIRGFKMLPAKVGKKTNAAGAGHWHIYVNGKYNTFSANAASGTTKVLKKGDYKVRVELANNDHSPLSEPTSSKTVRVMVGA